MLSDDDNTYGKAGVHDSHLDKPDLISMSLYRCVEFSVTLIARNTAGSLSGFKAKTPSIAYAALRGLIRIDGSSLPRQCHHF